MKVHDIRLIPTDQLVPSAENPQEMTTLQFNQLVKSIEESGFDENIIVVPTDNGKYQIVSGEHRWRAAQTLQIPEVPCVVQDYDDDTRRFQLVKRNALKGKLNAKKFVKLYESLASVYDKETISDMMSLDEDELEKLIGQVRSTLPPEMIDDFDNAKDEIKTIEDLSLILNELFAKYGETLDQHFMIFDFGGMQHVWIQCDKELWEQVDQFSQFVKRNKLDMTTIMKRIMSSSELKEVYATEGN